MMDTMDCASLYDGKLRSAMMPFIINNRSDSSFKVSKIINGSWCSLSALTSSEIRVMLPNTSPKPAPGNILPRALLNMPISWSWWAESWSSLSSLEVPTECSDREELPRALARLSSN
ncbi:hypothetical protein OGAPHI_005249 [Ogataea philodendri]|uniref:Uncharacterized protein n=1 Tax=Ogataea philodendri TaxID=1378263 RepID=A0A9P8T3I7_9ASCO|nr:uncharacterized protein OGAPHI_005249 [Ogataea philodendri]KAH3663846.1 hypothetical protein OGAPHI_005249 [Ogataea philodendri]